MAILSRPAIVKAQHAPFRPHSEKCGALHRNNQVRPPHCTRLPRLHRLGEPPVHLLGHQMEINFRADPIANFCGSGH